MIEQTHDSRDVALACPQDRDVFPREGNSRRCSLYIRVCDSMRAYAFPPWLARGKKERDGGTFHGANENRIGVLNHGLSRPLDVPLLRPRSARKNLLANVGRGYVGEPSPLVPFGISPYVPHFLFSSVSLSQFNSALSHRLSPYLPFFVALLVSIFFPLPVSPFLACLR